jgi:type I restriction enzyme S subunit
VSWKNEKLTEICTVTTGKWDANHASDKGEFRFYTCASKFLLCNTKRYDGKNIILPGNGANVGDVYFYDGAFDAYQRTYVLSDIKIIPEYLYYYLQSNWEETNRFKQYGSATNFLKIGNFKDFNVSYPPLVIQKKIVAKLDRIFAEIDKATVAAEDNTKNAEALFQSYLSKIIKKESENEKIVKLGTICEIARGGSPRPINKFITNDEDGVNWIKISDATRSKKYIFKTREKIIKSGVSRSRLVREGDLLLSNSMSYGRPYIMSTTGCIHDGWLVLSKYQKFLDIDFFYFLLSSAIIVKQFDNLAKGSTVSNLNKDLVSRVEFKLPSLSKQKLIVLKLNLLSNNVDIIKNSNSNKFNELLKLKQSILKQAFNDKLVKAA